MDPIAYTSKGRRLHMITDYAMPCSKRAKLDLRRHYWEEILRQSRSGSGCYNLALKMLDHINSEIAVYNSIERGGGLNEEKSENHMGAVGGPQHSDAGAGD